MTYQEVAEQLRELIRKHKVQLSWDESPISLEELIIARDGVQILEKIDEVLER